jgi:hypothetical protein
MGGVLLAALAVISKGTSQKIEKKSSTGPERIVRAM